MEYCTYLLLEGDVELILVRVVQLLLEEQWYISFSDGVVLLLHLLLERVVQILLVHLLLAEVVRILLDQVISSNSPLQGGVLM